MNQRKSCSSRPDYSLADSFMAIFGYYRVKPKRLNKKRAQVYGKKQNREVT